MNRNYYQWSWERFWTSGPISHAADIMKRTSKAHPGEVAFEQRGLVFPQNRNVVNNAGRVFSDIAAVVDPKDTLLVLPVFDYPPVTSDSAALLEELQTDVGPRIDRYGGVYVPIYPAGSLQDRIALSTAIITARGTMPRLRVAIPGDWGENTTADIIGSAVLTNVMKERMAANGRP
jgi:hypothetical protein